MIVLNSGNVLPLYQLKKHQNRFIGNCIKKHGRYALCARLGFGLPWQYLIQGPVNSISAVWEDENGNPIPAVGNIDVTALANGVTAITYFGSGLSGPTVDGFYTLVLTINNQTYYFEEQELKSNLSCYSQIAFSNKCNMKNVYYDNNYTQSFFFKGYQDSPLIDKQETAKLNGRGEVQIKAGSTIKQYCNIITDCVIDALVYPLSLIRHHSNIIYYPDESGLSYPNTKEFDITFTPNADSCYQTANIKFLTDNFQNDGCCPVDVAIDSQETISLQGNVE